MNNRVITATALAAVVAGALSAAQPTVAGDKEKCYGIAEAGQNDCANLAGTHSCAAQSTVNFDIGEYKVVDAGTCEALGGYSEEQARKIHDAQHAKKR